MNLAINIAVYLLILAAVLPLVLLALFAVGDYFKVPLAERMLGSIYCAFKMQSFVGSLVNILGGMAIMVLGIWAVSHAQSVIFQIGAATLIPFGLWRVLKGWALLSALMAR
nr:hypothetical protein [Brucella anthropi]